MTRLLAGMLVAAAVVVTGAAPPSPSPPGDAVAAYEARRDGDLVHLEDRAHGVAVSILTSVGHTAYRMTVNGHDILRFPFASVDEFRARPAGLHGIPLLAPWANRLDEPAFHANGQRYAFDTTLGNVRTPIPSHGLVSRTDRWQVVDVGHDAGAAWVTSRLEAFRQPAWMKQWPFAHTIEMTYRLAGGTLEVRTTITNHATEPMPVSIGYHPYFRLTDSPRDEWTIGVPARTRWLLSPQKLPTGETEPAASFFPDGTGLLRDYNLDDVFGDLVRDAQGRATATIRGRRQRIDVTVGPRYRALVVYAPNPANTGRGSQLPPPAPGQPPPPPPAARAPANPLATPDFVCVEPMAAITNALNLAHRGVYQDIQSIPPGGTWQESFWVTPGGF